ncbi:MAG: hypothetical protein AAGE96_17510 [Cyanobacteria bacterium P01_G01_bin.19]
MSLVQGRKSVFSLHLKKIIKNQNHYQGDSIALMGLGAILVGTFILPTMAKLGKPILKSIIKSGLTLYPVKKTISNSKLEFPELELITFKGKDVNLN